MADSVLVAILALVGTLGGSFGGIMASNKLVVFRLERLEKSVEKHNCLVERMAIVERDVKTAFRLIDEKGE